MITPPVFVESRVTGIPGRHVKIFCPDHASPNLPVLYMHDGQNVFSPGTAFGCWLAGEVAGAEISAGRVCPFLLVAIDNNGNERQVEYVPPGDHYANADDGKADAYATYVIEHVMPWVEQHHPVTRDPSRTAVAGSSLGGVVSLYMLLEHGRFGLAGSMSTAMCWAPRYLQSLTGRASIEARIYHDIGTREYLSMEPADYKNPPAALQRALEGIVVDPEQNLRFVIAEDADHNEAAWALRLPAMLRWMFPA